LARKRKGRPVDGILLLNKPTGISSNGALQRAKRFFFAAKAGHTGSLDPLATGVLPICLGEATKFSQFLLDADKGYRANVTLGVTTDSGDSDGNVIANADAGAVTEKQLLEVMDTFKGDILQVPSMFSALKKDGQPLYKLARAGIEIERPARPVKIRELELLSFEPGEKATFSINVLCSKGTYIRSLAEDIGKALGCGGHVTMLHRTRVGPFCESDGTVLLDELEQLKESDNYEAMDHLLLPINSALDHLPLVELDEDCGYYMKHGQAVMVPHLPTEGIVRLQLESGEFIGVGEILEDGRVAPRRLVATA
jgi:tRNA pseudouridine55 synthase